MAAAVREFCDATLAVTQDRVGKPLFGPLAGYHSARWGTYPIVYRIEENTRMEHILDIDHRRDLPPHRPHVTPNARCSPVPGAAALEAQNSSSAVSAERLTCAGRSVRRNIG